MDKSSPWNIDDKGKLILTELSDIKLLMNQFKVSTTVNLLAFGTGTLTLPLVDILEESLSAKYGVIVDKAVTLADAQIINSAFNEECKQFNLLCHGYWLFLSDYNGKKDVTQLLPNTHADIVFSDLHTSFKALLDALTCFTQEPTCRFNIDAWIQKAYRNIEHIFGEFQSVFDDVYVNHPRK